MPSIASTYKSLQSDYHKLSFKVADRAYWSSIEKTIYSPVPSCLEDLYDLFHEIGHALLGHQDYSKDIALIRMETQAWEKAKTISTNYSVSIPEEYVENKLETYRSWLYLRSQCPSCSAHGIQTHHATYTCLVCDSKWTNNSAFFCGLQRHLSK